MDIECIGFTHPKHVAKVLLQLFISHLLRNKIELTTQTHTQGTICINWNEQYRPFQLTQANRIVCVYLFLI